MVVERKRLGDLLVDSDYITEEQLKFALSEQEEHEKLGDILLREGYITEQQLIEVLEFQLGIPHINILHYPIDEEVVNVIPKEIAKRHHLVPIRIEDDQLFVAMADPLDYFAIEELRMLTGYQIVPGIAAKNALYQTITKYYDLQESLDEVMADYIPEEVFDDTGRAEEGSPVVNLVNQLIENAVAQQASDIHFDPQEKELKVRYRIDGVLHTERSLPKRMQNIIIARIKIMGNLNITENRIPQDGRFQVHVQFKPVDIRLSTLPTIYGEKIVMRILDLSNVLNQLDRLGFTDENVDAFQQMIYRPNGIVLITGPTGSGKSSTLYAGLNDLNDEEMNIITIEDPVEYQLKGINQIQVNEDVGVSFANGLRSILRQDPDIIMVGEIRDLATARIAIRASLTGHLVLSTLHTNSAIASLTRLIDMGIEPFLISSSLTGVIAQRLVRKICRDCIHTFPATEQEKDLFYQSDIEVSSLQKGKGCPSCRGTGYRGRMAIHEALTIDDKIRDFIMRSASASQIRKHIKNTKFSFLVDDGLKKAAQGLTTVEEVLRVSAVE